MNIDELLMQAPAGYDYRNDLLARPKYAVAQDERNPYTLGFYGFDVGVPLRLWREYFLPHVEKLIDEPSIIFGLELQATGWFASISPEVPVRSVDQLVWINFKNAEHAARQQCANNLTCAPGVRLGYERGLKQEH